MEIILCRKDAWFVSKVFFCFLKSRPVRPNSKYSNQQMETDIVRRISPQLCIDERLSITPFFSGEISFFLFAVKP